MKYIIQFFFFISIFFQKFGGFYANNIIKNFNDINNLSFKFKQNINDKTQEGNCLIEYPKKIYCEYKKK